MKSERGDTLRLLDILDAIIEIEHNLPKSRQRFDANELLKSHLFRHVMIVGEATFKLSKDLRARHPEVPWEKIASMRHILVHDYFKVNWDRL